MTLQAIIIEDEKLVAWSLSEHLKKLKFNTLIFEFGEEGIEKALNDPPDILFVDYRLPDISGIEILQKLQPIKEHTIFFFMTAYGTQDIAIEALRLGAFEYLNKPVNFDEITVLIHRALKERKRSQEINILKEREEKIFQLGSYISKSPKMQEIVETAQKLAGTESGTILLLGETGTGKDTLARVIHEHSPRKDKPFIIVNCASLTENLLESELFGYEKGAFTDAKTRKFGQVELADGGTVYLDEIGEIPIGFQAKLLRFIDTQTFYRVGGTRELSVNVRIIASTNRDLREEMRSGNFREDLFYRLNVISLTLPPLRERKEDIPLLVERFIELFNAEFNYHVQGISKFASNLIHKYHWPGNVRELKNTIERIFLLENPTIIETWHFPQYIREYFEESGDEEIRGQSQKETPASFFEGKTFADVEKLLVQWALDTTNGNQSQAAKLLDLTRDQIRYKMKKHSLL
ncbi:MAG: sigma-54-dependent Fis family transcriptional regulator [FCB group bacterium]|nr:sigma-54-dependent Fis family transcriptional regulator [FCB group bacterium]